MKARISDSTIFVGYLNLVTNANILGWLMLIFII